MTVTFGFYNSVSNDRKYDAVQISSMFDGVLTDGVFEHVGNALAITDGVGMNVVVGTGKAWFNHTWTINDASLILPIQPSDLILPRIDTVILEVDASVGVRANSIKVLTGTPASVPFATALINTSEIHQHALAYIAVAPTVTEITAGDVNNLIGTGFCPYVVFAGTSGGSGANVLEVQIFS